MASGPNLPPQAYTREMLTAAFNWLQSQPESVRKSATTPDVLVGIYSRAKRFGNSSPEADAPVSSQNFKSDLKNLAEGLREFEEPREIPPKRPVLSQSGPYATAPSPTSAAHQPFPGSSPGGFAIGAVPSFPSAPTASGLPPAGAAFSSDLATPPAAFPALNERSRAMIHEVKSQMNLSSDAEAINMMVAVAYKSLKDLLA